MPTVRLYGKDGKSEAAQVDLMVKAGGETVSVNVQPDSAQEYQCQEKSKEFTWFSTSGCVRI